MDDLDAPPFESSEADQVAWIAGLRADQAAEDEAELASRRERIAADAGDDESPYGDLMAGILDQQGAEDEAEVAARREQVRARIAAEEGDEAAEQAMADVEALLRAHRPWLAETAEPAPSLPVTTSVTSSAPDVAPRRSRQRRRRSRSRGSPGRLAAADDPPDLDPAGRADARPSPPSARSRATPAIPGVRASTSAARHS